MKSVFFVFLGAIALLNAQPAPAHGSSYVGVMMQEIDSQRARDLKLPEEAGVEITRIEPDSPAEHAGLKTGDVILNYNGEHVEGMEQFSRLVRETPAGREVKLGIFRGGTPQTVTVKVAARRVAQFAMAPPAPMGPVLPLELRMPDIPRSFMTWRSSALGMECETLEGQLANYFGVKQGVLVRSVTKGSAAEHAGIRAGDVITRVDGSKVATPADVSSAVRTRTRGKAVPMSLTRDHKEMTLSVVIDDGDRME